MNILEYSGEGYLNYLEIQELICIKRLEVEVSLAKGMRCTFGLKKGHSE